MHPVSEHVVKIPRMTVAVLWVIHTAVLIMGGGNLTVRLTVHVSLHTVQEPGLGGKASRPRPQLLGDALQFQTAPSGQ